LHVPQFTQARGHTPVAVPRHAGRRGRAGGRSAGFAVVSPGAGYSATMAAQTLVIKVTAGKDEPERCGQALTVAATAIASGVAVSLWLAAEAAWLALPGRADDIVLPHSPPLADLLASIVAGGRVTLCTQCAARRDIGPGDVIEGIRIGGAATFVSEITADGTQALVY
jgi:predicted peroxiredoxin